MKRPSRRGDVKQVPLDGEVRQYLSQVLTGAGEEQAERALVALARADCPAASDMSTGEGIAALVDLLAKAGRRVPLKTVAAWSVAQREEARCWAARLLSVDHPALPPPPSTPECLGGSHG